MANSLPSPIKRKRWLITFSLNVCARLLVICHAISSIDISLGHRDIRRYIYAFKADNSRLLAGHWSRI